MTFIFNAQSKILINYFTKVFITFQEEKQLSPDSAVGPMLGNQKKDKTCLVCGDKALGYNFNAVSCESCKAFFRRNAHKVSLKTTKMTDSCMTFVCDSLFMLTLFLMNFLNGVIHVPYLELSIIILRDIKVRTWKLVSQQYRAWSDCMDLQAGLALYWQRLITFGSGRIRVNLSVVNSGTINIG